MNTKKTPLNEIQVKLDPANPKNTIEEDCFERAEFAQSLANLLTRKDDQSIVAAIEADWGEGKTTIINFARDQINKMHPRTITVSFQPWLFHYDKLEALVRDYMNTLICKLTKLEYKRSKYLCRRWLRNHKKSKWCCDHCNWLLKAYQWIISKLPFKNSIFSIGINVLGKFRNKYGLSTSINALKEDVNNWLTKARRPIVVIIDDIDRLQPDEIRMIFQLIKSICDFRGINYLVAYDTKPVIKSLSYDEIHDGQQYLEKIVQIPLRLPRISKFHIRRFFKDNLENLLQLLAISPSENETESLNQLYIDQRIIGFLRTPRDVYRIINKLKLILPAIYKEVNIVDTIVFQILDLKLPKVASLVYNNPYAFVSTYEGGGPQKTYMERKKEAQQNNEPQPEYIELVEHLKLPDSKKADVLYLLDFIFNPTTQTQQSQITIEKDTENLRVTISHHFQKLLHIGNNSYSLSAQEAITFLSSEEERPRIFQDWFENEHFGAFWPQVSNYIDNANIADIPALLSDLATFDLRIYSGDRRIVRRISQCTLSCLILKKKVAPDKLFDYLVGVMESRTMLAFSEDILLNYLGMAEMWKGGIYDEMNYSSENTNLTKEQLTELKEFWLVEVRQASNSKTFIAETPKIVSVLFRWGQLSINPSPYDEVQNYLSNALQNKKELAAFIRGWDGNGLNEAENIIPKNTYNLFNTSTIEGAPRIYNHLSSLQDLDNTKTAS